MMSVLNVFLFLVVAVALPASAAGTEENFFCFGTVAAKSQNGRGIIMPSNTERYANNADCTWTIQAPEGKVILLTVASAELEPSADRLVMRDPNHPMSHGNDADITRDLAIITQYRSQGRDLTIMFHSDASVIKDGFRLEFMFIDATACGTADGAPLTEVGVLVDGFETDVPLPTGLLCTWVIKSADLMQNVDVKAHSGKTHDEPVNVYADEAKTLFLGTVGGSTGQQRLVSYTGVLVIELDTRTEPHTHLYLTTSFRGACRENPLVAGTQTASDVQYTLSAGGPGTESTAYTNNLDCRWHIVAPDNHVIVFEYMAMELEERLDWLAVRETVIDRQHPVPNTKSTQSVRTTTGELEVTFHSDHSNAGAGWKLGFTFVPADRCGNDAVTEAGSFTDGFARDSVLPPNIACTWVMTAPGPTDAISIDIKLDGPFTAGRTTHTIIAWADVAKTQLLGQVERYSPDTRTPSRAVSRATFLSYTGTIVLTLETGDNTKSKGFTVEVDHHPGCPRNNQVINGPEPGIIMPTDATSGAYVDNQDCTWTIQAPPGQNVIATLENLGFEANLDYLTVVDPDFQYTHVQESQSLMKHVKRTTFRSTARKFVVVFHSDRSKHGFGGFRLAYRFVSDKECGGTIDPLTMENMQHLITDGFTPGFSPPGIECVWTVTSLPASTSLELSVDHIGVPCVDANVVNEQAASIRYYSDASRSEFYGQSCVGNKGDILSYTGTIVIVLNTGFNGAALVASPKFHNHFQMTVRLRPACPLSGTVIDDMQRSTTLRPTNALSGAYVDNQRCKWQIMAPVGFNILVTVKHLSLEKDLDWLRVYDTLIERDYLPNEQASFLPRSKLIRSVGREIDVVFYSDRSKSDFSGWQLEWSFIKNTVCGTGAPITEANLPFTDGFTDVHVPPHLECEYIVQAPPSHTLVLDFTESMNIHCDDGQALNVYGDADKTLLLMTTPVCGQQRAKTLSLMSYTGMMVIVYVTGDTDAQDVGFAATPKFLPSCDRSSETLTDDNGRIDMTTYVDKQRCQWTIEAPEQYNVEASFPTIGLERPHDTVTAVDPAATDSAKGGVLFDSNALKPANTFSPVFTTVGRRLIVTFFSDGSRVNAPGFVLTYKFTRCLSQACLEADSDVCSAVVERSCRQRLRLPCTRGVESAECGACQEGYEVDAIGDCVVLGTVDHCVDRTLCSDLLRDGGCVDSPSECGPCVSSGYRIGASGVCRSTLLCSNSQQEMCVAKHRTVRRSCIVGEEEEEWRFNCGDCTNNWAEGDVGNGDADSGSQECVCKGEFVLRNGHCVRRIECTEAMAAQCRQVHRLALNPQDGCSLDGDNCGVCRAGYTDGGDRSAACRPRITDGPGGPCSSVARLQCIANGRVGCTPGTSACGPCRSSYRETSDGHCVKADKCGPLRVLQCLNSNRAPCQKGSWMCGPCKHGFVATHATRQNSLCVPRPDVCSAKRANECAEQMREPCVHGSDQCGACLSGYVAPATGSWPCVVAEPDPVCSLVNLVACDASHRERCTLGQKDTSCGDCVKGFVEAAGVCKPVQSCTSLVQSMCASRNRASCSFGSTRCGTCLPGFVSSESSNDEAACVEKLAGPECSFRDGRVGVCMSSTKCPGELQSGRCLGMASSVRCCIPKIPRPDPCTFRDGRVGKCKYVRNCAGGEVVVGRCPHLPSDVRCCWQPNGQDDGKDGAPTTQTPAQSCAAFCATEYNGDSSALKSLRRSCDSACTEGLAASSDEFAELGQRTCNLSHDSADDASVVHAACSGYAYASSATQGGGCAKLCDAWFTHRSMFAHETCKQLCRRTRQFKSSPRRDFPDVCRQRVRGHSD